MAEKVNLSIAANFEKNLQSIRCFYHEQNHPEHYTSLLDRLFDIIIPNLQEHPLIGFDFLAQRVNSIEEQRQVENIKKRLPSNSSIRQYNSQDYILLYSLKDSDLVFLAIKHQRQLYFDLRAT